MTCVKQKQSLEKFEGEMLIRDSEHFQQSSLKYIVKVFLIAKVIVKLIIYLDDRF